MPPKTARRELEQSTKDKIIGMDITGWSCQKNRGKIRLGSINCHQGRKAV
jgi:hypothetical protein